MNTSTVSVIDDEPDIRDALGMLLRSVGHNVKTYDSAQAYWDNFDPNITGCLVLDVRMPGMSGMELQARLKDLQYHPPIIMISGHGEIPMAVSAIKDGAIDFLQKPFSDQVLLDRVQQALHKDEEQRAKLEVVEDIKTNFEKLTEREREVMGAITQGKLNKVIAYELGVSTRTVEIHRARVMEKMGVRSVSSLTRKVAVLEENNIIT